MKCRLSVYLPTTLMEAASIVMLKVLFGLVTAVTKVVATSSLFGTSVELVNTTPTSATV